MRRPFRALMIVIAVAAVVAVLSLAAGPTSGQAPASGSGSQLPRRAGGKPDLSGVWQTNNTANWDLQTHTARPAVGQPGVYPDVPVLAAPVVALGTVGWVPAGRGVVEGEDIPYLPAAAAKKKENFEHWLDRDPELKCFMPGVPRAMYLPYPFQIVQGTNQIMMVFEFANASRTIHLNEVEPYPSDSWMGHSVGRWEGDTLVVDVTSQIDKTWLDRAGNFHSDAIHVVERYTPISLDAIRYEATIEDPQVFTRPWKITMPLYRRLEPNAQLMEFQCKEMVEETLLGHLRKQQLVKHWEGNNMIVDITRRIPPGEKVYER
jgi:hypothetical protein